MPDFYGTESDFSDYVVERGYTVASGDVAAALVRASTFIDGKYGARFSGVKTGGRSQLRAWPRTGAYDAEGIAILEDEVPIEVEYATYEAARQELTTPGSLNPVLTASKSIKRVKVEGAVEVEYANTDSYDSIPQLTIIDGILAPLLSGMADYSGGLFGRNYRV